MGMDQSVKKGFRYKIIMEKVLIEVRDEDGFWKNEKGYRNMRMDQKGEKEFYLQATR